MKDEGQNMAINIQIPFMKRIERGEQKTKTKTSSILDED